MDEYERRIREKVWASECLTAGEWVYLVGLFQMAREYEELQRKVCHCGKDGHALNSVNCPVHGYKIVRLNQQLKQEG